MDELNGFKRDCLYAIAGLGTPTGPAVQQVLDDYYSGEVYPARLYPALDSLVEEGLLVKEPEDGRTNRYLLTDAGRRVLAERRRWEDQHVDDLVELVA